jgi:hypothetical protein
VIHARFGSTSGGLRIQSVSKLLHLLQSVQADSQLTLAAYHRLEQKYASILGDRQAYVVHRGLGRGSMGWAHVHVGADNRASAEKLCADLRGAGVSYCEVQRARSAR